MPEPADPARAAAAEVMAVVAPLAARFTEAGFRLYLVGGLVRDLQRGGPLDTDDIDCTTDARPDEIVAVLEGWADDLWTQGARFGTVGARRDGHLYEITTHRSEVYVDDSRKPVVTFSTKLDDDLSRRDFTVNAMAIDPDDGALIDPFGGVDDLARRVLRTPLDPDVSFSEDPLRMVRAARFHAAYDLTPTGAVLDSIRRLRHRMPIVSIERVRDELGKVLVLPAASRGLNLIRDLEVVDHLLPEIRSVESFEPVDRCASRGACRYAVFAHLLDSRRPSAVARRLRHANATVAEVGRLATGAAELGDPTRWWTDEDVRRFVRSRAPEVGSALDDVVEVATARWHAEPAALAAVARAAARIAELASTEDLTALGPILDGDDVKRLLGLDEGPAVGRALAALLDRRLREGPSTREDEERYLLVLGRAPATSPRVDRER